VKTNSSNKGRCLYPPYFSVVPTSVLKQSKIAFSFWLSHLCNISYCATDLETSLLLYLYLSCPKHECIWHDTVNYFSSLPFTLIIYFTVLPLTKYLVNWFTVFGFKMCLLENIRTCISAFFFLPSYSELYKELVVWWK